LLVKKKENNRNIFCIKNLFLIDALKLRGIKKSKIIEALPLISGFTDLFDLFDFSWGLRGHTTWPLPFYKFWNKRDVLSPLTRDFFEHCFNIKYLNPFQKLSTIVFEKKRFAIRESNLEVSDDVGFVERSLFPTLGAFDKKNLPAEFEDISLIAKYKNQNANLNFLYLHDTFAARASNALRLENYIARFVKNYQHFYQEKKAL